MLIGIFFRIWRGAQCTEPYLNEFSIQRLERFACAFIKNSLFHTFSHKEEPKSKKLVISILPNMYKIDHGVQGSPTITGEFTERCKLAPLNQFASSRESYTWY